MTTDPIETAWNETIGKSQGIPWGDVPGNAVTDYLAFVARAVLEMHGGDVTEEEAERAINEYYDARTAGPQAMQHALRDFLSRRHPEPRAIEVTDEMIDRAFGTWAAAPRSRLLRELVPEMLRAALSVAPRPPAPKPDTAASALSAYAAKLAEAAQELADAVREIA